MRRTLLLVFLSNVILFTEWILEEKTLSGNENRKGWMKGHKETSGVFPRDSLHLNSGVRVHPGLEGIWS